MIQFAAPVIDKRSRAYVRDVLRREWISQGRYTTWLEREWAAACGADYGVACSSGTAALHLGLLAMGVGPGDVVIVPALTYVASANAVRYCGASVRFADIDPDSWTIDPASVDEQVRLAGEWSNRQPYVMPVHLYDAVADLGALETFDLIEDAAHTLGALLPDGRCAGAVGKVAAFSLHASKIVGCGEGGMVLTNDKTLADEMRLLRSQADHNLSGAAPRRGHYRHDRIGHNYRLTDLQAAVALAQLEQVDRLLEAHRRIAIQYRDALEDLVTFQGGSRASAWTTALLVPEDISRDWLMEELWSDGIECRAFFEPLPAQAAYRHWVPPVAKAVAERGLCLPTHPGMTSFDVERVCQRVIDALREPDRQTDRQGGAA